MSRLVTVAWKDFQDAGRSRMLWGLVGLLVLLVTLIYGAIWWTVDDPAPVDIVGPASAVMQLIVPIVAAIAGYRAIVGERQSGSVKVLLALPPTRRDVVFGKLLGRSATVAAAILAAFLTLILLSLVLFRSVPLVEFAAIAGASVLVGLAFVGIAVGISAGVTSRGQAMAGVIGLYLVFLLFWDLGTAGLYRLLEGELPGNPGDQFEAWYVFLQWLNPVEAYGILTDAVFEESFGAFTIPIFAPQQPSAVDRVVAGEVPWYLDEWVLVPVLAAWYLGPVFLGYLRFRRADLG
ncbi:MAG: ABC transporter permease subunit [Halobacteriales archaeon]